ncbi:MAG TPA: M48 family metalloprotease [Aquabacterium sp.]|uniref:M48 family metalloprotease n=1 Tax=Aquabacterium sp. TaxID=1872578 RepID=UPI002E2F7790|nr:M48 family metalloprotease [Aquabacterium sp.]HEX5372528.1 M48 family metalloprotease [Aquabacterium sp.]
MATHTVTAPLRSLALLLGIGLTALPLGLQAQGRISAAGTLVDAPLPALGDSNSQSLSPAAERRLGDRIMRSILRDPDVIDDPLAREYVQALWSALLSSARQRGDLSEDLDTVYAWSPFLIRDRSVNAFALPGGYIGVHLGLLSMTRSPDELASVLAHELSHVTQRHIARMMSQAKQTSWVSIASMVLGALAMSRNPEGAQALIVGGQGLAAQGQLNFSRDMEREADRVGFGVMGEAGFAPAGMMQMFEQLQMASRLNDDNNYPYLRTHPLTTERIGEARARMGGSGLQIQAIDPASRSEALQALSLRHALMAARSRVLMDTRSASLQPWIKPPSLPPGASPTAILAQHYTRLVAATQLKDRAHADDALSQARATLAPLKDGPAREARRMLALAELEALLATGRVMQAQSLLGDGLLPTASSLSLDARPEVILRARIALSLPDARDNRREWQDAAGRLQTLVSLQPDDATAWSLLSSLWSRLGQPLRAVRAEAEATAAQGDLQGGIDRIDAARKRFAQTSSADLIELTVMDSRARRWRQTQRDDASEDLK